MSAWLRIFWFEPKRACRLATQLWDLSCYGEPQPTL